MKVNSKKLISVLTILVLGFTVSACSMRNDNLASNDDEYIYVIDSAKVNAVERARVSSNSSLRIYWLNPPVKKVKKSEYQKRLKK